MMGACTTTPQLSPLAPTKPSATAIFRSLSLADWYRLRKSDRRLLQDRIFRDLALVEHHLRDLRPGEATVDAENEERLIVRREALTQPRNAAPRLGARAGGLARRSTQVRVVLCDRQRLAPGKAGPDCAPSHRVHRLPY